MGYGLAAAGPGGGRILVTSGDAQNRECWGALFEVVERVAELLGAVPVAR